MFSSLYLFTFFALISFYRLERLARVLFNRSSCSSVGYSLYLKLESNYSNITVTLDI
jgi:hypothetical protein